MEGISYFQVNIAISIINYWQIRCRQTKPTIHMCWAT